MNKGLRFLVGDGKEIQLWNDLWLPINPPRPPRPLLGAEDQFHFVEDLMNNRNSGWDMEKIETIIVPKDRALIMQLKLSAQSNHDLLGWHYTNYGLYTVKSSYWLATHLPDQENQVIPPPGLPEFKTAIWKMKTAPKLQHFMRRLLSNALAIGSTLTHRGIILDPQCRRYCNAEETMHHLFF